jgi:hypothetical protein
MLKRAVVEAFEKAHNVNVLDGWTPRQTSTREDVLA